MPNSPVMPKTASHPDEAPSLARPPVALIAGPTASGKSALAIALAQAANGIVINADASQVYADIAILSARPSAQEMAQTPHRLFGYIDGAEPCSAARWAADARAEISRAHAAGQLPVLVGGTGLYIRTLIDGIAPIPDIDPDIRTSVRALPVGEAYAALDQEDPAAAARLNAGDSARIARALEVVRSTGQSIAHWQAERVGGIGDAISLHPLILLPPRDWLIERCDRRFLVMLDNGAFDEVAALRARALAPALPVMRAIGVPEISAFLDGRVDHATMVAQGQSATRRYAKRQYTWFAHQPPVNWPRFRECTYDTDSDNIIRLFRL